MSLKTNSKFSYGIGINDADYVVKQWITTGYIDGKQKQKLVWSCPFYIVWYNMLKRCYSAESKEKWPTYKDCTVCEEWHLFSTFKAWMEQQDWEGKQLDKDLLIKGNKVYSPETCVFVSGLVNSFMLDCGASRGEYLIGVWWDDRNSNFKAKCSNPLTKSRKGMCLGAFDTEQEAHNAWLKRKLEHAHALAAMQTDERVAKALIDRYTNYSTDFLAVDTQKEEFRAINLKRLISCKVNGVDYEFEYGEE